MCRRTSAQFLSPDSAQNMDAKIQNRYYFQLFKVLPVFMAFLAHISAHDFKSDNSGCTKEFTFRKSGQQGGNGFDCGCWRDR